MERRTAKGWPRQLERLQPKSAGSGVENLKAKPLKQTSPSSDRKVPKVMSNKDEVLRVERDSDVVPVSCVRRNKSFQNDANRPGHFAANKAHATGCEKIGQNHEGD